MITLVNIDMMGTDATEANARRFVEYLNKNGITAEYTKEHGSVNFPTEEMNKVSNVLFKSFTALEKQCEVYKEYAADLLRKTGCADNLYCGTSIDEIVEDLELYQKENGVMCEFPIDDVAYAIRMVCDEVPIPSEAEMPTHCAMWNTENAADGIYCCSEEEAKDTALGILQEWIDTERKELPEDIEAWTEEEIERWNMMIAECSVSVVPLDEKGEYSESLANKNKWYPSRAELRKLLWVDYEELVVQIGR